MYFDLKGLIENIYPLSISMFQKAFFKHSKRSYTAPSLLATSITFINNICVKPFIITTPTLF